MVIARKLPLVAALVVAFLVSVRLHPVVAKRTIHLRIHTAPSTNDDLVDSASSDLRAQPEQYDDPVNDPDDENSKYADDTQDDSTDEGHETPAVDLDQLVDALPSVPPGAQIVIYNVDVDVDIDIDVDIENGDGSGDSEEDEGENEER